MNTRLPGFVRTQRFQAVRREGRAEPAFGFLALYEYSGPTCSNSASSGR